MDKLILAEDIENGLSTRLLAEKYNVGQTTIRYWLKKFNLKTKPAYKYSANNGFKYDSSKLQELIDQGLTYKKLRDALGVSSGTLSSLSQRGLIKFKSRSEIGKIKFASNDHPFHNRESHIYKKPRGGYRKHAGRGQGAYVLDSFGKRTYLQSSFELKCFDILTSLDIKWIRPEPLTYISDKTRKYYPDFYLINYDLYLDPKNDYLIKLDFDKIQKVREQNNVKIEVLSELKITEEYIKSVL